MDRIGSRTYAEVCELHPNLLAVASCASCPARICGLCSQQPLQLCGRCYKRLIVDEAEGARTRLIFLPVFAICGMAFVWFSANLVTIFAAMLPVWIRLLATNHGVFLMPLVAAWCMGTAYGTMLIARTSLRDTLWLPPPFTTRNTQALGGLLIGGVCLPFGVAADLSILRRARELQRAVPAIRNVTRVALPQPHPPPRQG